MDISNLRAPGRRGGNDWQVEGRGELRCCAKLGVETKTNKKNKTSILIRLDR